MPKFPTNFADCKDLLHVSEFRAWSIVVRHKVFDTTLHVSCEPGQTWTETETSLVRGGIQPLDGFNIYNI